MICVCVLSLKRDRIAGSVKGKYNFKGLSSPRPYNVSMVALWKEASFSKGQNRKIEKKFFPQAIRTMNA